MVNRLPQGKKAKIVDVVDLSKQNMTKEQYEELNKKYQQAVEARDMHYHNAVENLEADISAVSRTYGSAEGVRAVLYNDVLKKLDLAGAAHIAFEVQRYTKNIILKKFHSTQDLFEKTDIGSKEWSEYLDSIINYGFARFAARGKEPLDEYDEFVTQLVIKDLYARFGQAGHDIDVQWQKDQELVDSIDEALKEAEKALAGPNE